MNTLGLLFVIAVVVAWVGGGLSVWLTRHDADTDRLIRELRYLAPVLDDLTEVLEKLTAGVETIRAEHLVADNQVRPEPQIRLEPPLTPKRVAAMTEAAQHLDAAADASLKAELETDVEEPLLDPDCRALKHNSCVGGQCACSCHVKAVAA